MPSLPLFLTVSHLALHIVLADSSTITQYNTTDIENAQSNCSVSHTVPADSCTITQYNGTDIENAQRNCSAIHTVPAKSCTITQYNATDIENAQSNCTAIHTVPDDSCTITQYNDTDIENAQSNCSVIHTVPDDSCTITQYNATDIENAQSNCSAIHTVPTDSCTITQYNATDIKNAQSQCSAIIISNIKVPAGERLDLTKLKQGASVTFQGTITWGYKEWQGPLIRVSGTNVYVTGSPDHVLDGNGSIWWDELGSNGGKTKPKFFQAHKMINSEIYKLNIKNTPRHTFSIINCDNLTIDSVNIDNSAGDSGGGHNTDAFDVGKSNGITITNCTVHNQDDCLAVNSGTNIVFCNNYCYGGHGISIGSVGKRDNNVVQNVTICNNTVANSDNGVRIKTIYNATGSVSNVAFENITLSKIRRYGIIIEGDYENGRPTGQPTDGVPVTDIKLKNIKGSVESGGANIFVLVQNASNWSCSGVNVTGGTKPKNCTGIPTDADLSCHHSN